MDRLFALEPMLYQEPDVPSNVIRILTPWSQHQLASQRQERTPVQTRPIAERPHDQIYEFRKRMRADYLERIAPSPERVNDYLEGIVAVIVHQKHVGTDYRTFSRRTVGDSKALERNEGAVLRLVGAVLDLPPSRNARASFSALGLERFSQPLLLSGPCLLSGADISAISYVGIPPAAIDTLTFVAEPEYVLTIENFASFNRHVLEADPCRRGLALYVGGYPSLGTQKALRALSERLPVRVPFFHWSDIDPDGTWIFKTIEAAVERRLTPHLMSRELAEIYGEPIAGQARLRRGEGGASGIASLIDYLASAEAKVMEQEQIDPRIPGEG